MHVIPYEGAGIHGNHLTTALQFYPERAVTGWRSTWEKEIAQKFTPAAMRYLAISQPISTVCPGTAFLLFFLRLIADALQANLSAFEFDSYVFLAVALLLDHNKAIMCSGMNLSPALRNDVPAIFCGFCNQQNYVCKEIPNSPLQGAFQWWDLACVHLSSHKLASRIRRNMCFPFKQDSLQHWNFDCVSWLHWYGYFCKMCVLLFTSGRKRLNCCSLSVSCLTS